MDDLKPLNLKKKKHKGLANFLGKYKFFILFFVIFGLVVFYWQKSSGNIVFNYVFGQGTTLKVINGRVNILLLGIGGGNHDGPNLTDTIMVASFNTVTHQANLISLPRDLWVDNYKTKINVLYQLGLDKQSLISGENKGDGLGLVQKEVGNILGLEIPYAVRVDFDGFVKAVDLVGGIDIDVAHSFDDYIYPLEGKEKEMCGYTETEMDINEEQSKTFGVTPGKFKVLLDSQGKIATVAAQPKQSINYTDDQVINYFSCRFEHLSFKAGPDHMDGITALKFVRSRHGTNNEGSDFARSKRQQLVLQSFKEKVLSLQTLTDPRKIIELIKTFGNSIETNINQSDYLEFIKLVKGLTSVKNTVIDSSGDKPLLVSPPVGDYGAWVLVPAGGDLLRIHQFVTNILSVDASVSAQPSPR